MKQKQIKVRNQILGQGHPKICISIMGRSLSELLDATRRTLKLDGDIYEWRADSFETAADAESVIEALHCLRKQMGDYPLIFTLRSEREGGRRTLSSEVYSYINKVVIESGLADIIDVEVSRDEGAIKNLVTLAHEKGRFILLSEHVFDRTPSKKEMLSILCRMQELGADISKLAVMAKSEADVLSLFDTTLAMKEKYGDRPFITIAMGEKGSLSRIAGGFFGSAMTFAKGIEASAPGQLEASEVRHFLDLLK